jgi:hypothetical protein
VKNSTVLKRGNYTRRRFLFIGEGSEAVTAVYAADMQPCKIYNVKKAVWHTHTLSRDAMVLIVENRDTTVDNSPFCNLTDPQRQTIAALAEHLWTTDGVLAVSI